MERLNFAEFKAWEVVKVKIEGKAPMISMKLGAGMIDKNTMLIFGGMLAKEDGTTDGEDAEDAFFFDVNTQTVSEAPKMEQAIRMAPDEVKLINGKLYAVGEVNFEPILSIYNIAEKKWNHEAPKVIALAPPPWKTGVKFEEKKYVDDGNANDTHFVKVWNPSNDGKSFYW
jgi:hypothetical protein